MPPRTDLRPRLRRWWIDGPRQCAPSRPARSRHGLTLADLVITTLIIGILAAVAAPRLAGALDKQRAMAAAKRIASDLNYARRYARTKGAEETVSFDVPNHRYALSSAKDLDRPTSGYSVDITSYPYSAKLHSAKFDGKSQVSFNAYGVPSAGGAVVVLSGSARVAVRLDGDSGRATVQP